MKNMDDISTKILRFHSQLDGNDNHRYKSWEHCYSYFIQDKTVIDTACLQMAFYLASWGMYRGSSFLLWKDYLIHKEVVAHLIQHKHLQKLNFIDTTEKEIKEIFELISWVKNWYQNNIDFVNGEKKKVNVTDTLATKIILGALGCIPAYDRYFIDGIRSKGLSYSGLKPKNFSSVVNFYKENRNSFLCAHSEVLKRSSVSYPPMKLVDMYFWEIGYELDNK
ncbi:hypothetical protein [Thiomicrorhabdus chilensis]|uniref:hypothetical protein n=1 Tax=Thiomicrorhabdus chilensis TaxID=63656 RepID=UPI00048DCF27|nr:hypothetical protein [Thiomicrorhabdus chilensis]